LQFAEKNGTLCVGFLVNALPELRGFRQKQTGRLLARGRRLLMVALASLGLLVVLVTVSPLLRWWTAWLAGPWTDPKGDVLIVLAGDATAGDLIGRSSYWRALYAVLVWKRGETRHVFITGGSQTGTAVAETMKHFMVCSGVPAGIIEVETASTSTHQSARAARDRWPREPRPSLMLLTSDYHMFRAHRAFQNQGLPVLPRPIPDAGKQFQQILERWSVFLNLLVETTKVVYYWSRGWI
jgi:uncharacterized SAM-binding protein YcdF (DUF218 family)